MFLLSLNGCGHKKSPYHIENISTDDENIKFIKIEPSENETESSEDR